MSFYEDYGKRSQEAEQRQLRKRFAASPLATTAQVLAVIAIGFYLMYHEIATGWMPSLFVNSLGDPAYVYWHRWVPLSWVETLMPGTLIVAVWLIVSQTFDPVYNFVRRYPWAPMIVPAAFLGFLLFRDVYAGFAVYGDRIAVRTPISGWTIREYRAADIARVEVGCHERWRARRNTPNWAVPSYRMVMRDGSVVSPFDLADASFRDPALMTAMLRFDKQAEAAGVPKQYRLNVFDYRMDGAACFDRMEGYYHPSFRAPMRRAFLSKGTGDWQ